MGLLPSIPANAHLWLPGVLASRRRNGIRPGVDGVVDILLCIADHFEPDHASPSADVELARVDAWVERFPKMAQQFADSSGRPPQHTFFFPVEGYKPRLLDRLSELCRRGFGDVEVHLHHDDDSAEKLRESLEWFADTLFHRHGLLRRSHSGQITYGFIHGNWALDNARPDGKWCGVNNELTVLRESGCYADFTLPAAPDICQTRTVNSIYYAIDNPLMPKSHDAGIVSSVGRRPPQDGLLIVQGPLTFDWRRRIWRVLPGLENGAIDDSAAHLPTLERFMAWVDVGVGVKGCPNWVFVKVHTHGAPEWNASVLLGPVMERFHADISRNFNDGTRYRLHYVTAYEMATLVKAAENGHVGNPQEFIKSHLI